MTPERKCETEDIYKLMEEAKSAMLQPETPKELARLIARLCDALNTTDWKAFNAATNERERIIKILQTESFTDTAEMIATIAIPEQMNGVGAVLKGERGNG